MNYHQLICSVCLFCFSVSMACAEADFSKIEEQLLLNPTADGNSSDEVMIYTRVRNKTIQRAMDNQFDRIENMMFINTIFESDTGELAYADDDC